MTTSKVKVTSFYHDGLIARTDTFFNNDKNKINEHIESMKQRGFSIRKSYSTTRESKQ